MGFLRSIFILSLLGFPRLIEAEEWKSESLFNIHSDWTRHDGKKVKLSSLGDSPKIVAMVFLSCKYSCPITVQDLKAMEKKIAAKTSKKFGMVLISIDPLHDTPDAMRKFAKERELDLGRWTIMTSSAPHIRELAAALGFSYKEDEAMKFAHSMLTWALDESGLVKFERIGQKQSVDETVDALLKLLP